MPKGGGRGEGEKEWRGGREWEEGGGGLGGEAGGVRLTARGNV